MLTTTQGSLGTWSVHWFVQLIGMAAKPLVRLTRREFVE